MDSVMPLRRKVLLSLGGLVLGVLLVGLLDRALGQAEDRPAGEPGLVLAPGSRARYQTPEFEFTVQANAHGLRDHPISAKQPGKPRVLVLGDSFVYGWGVELSESWVKLVEADLGVEVLNAGQPGGYPRHYAATLERAMPLLQPDLIVVAVLQGDDLAQYVYDRSETPPNPTPACAGACRLFPALTRLVHAESLATDTFAADARHYIAKMDPPSRARFDALDPDVRTAYLAGDLNPQAVYLGVAHPDYFARSYGSEALAGDLARLQAIAHAGGARLAVVSLPHRAYLGEREQAPLRRLGFDVPAAMQSEEHDAIIKRAAGDVPFLTVTEAYRALDSPEPLFYPLDGHWTPAGNRRFAELIGPPFRGVMIPALQ